MVTSRARVWLAGGGVPPTDQPVVRDDQSRTWRPANGQWHTADGRHHQAWQELSARTDLVEVMG
jgi:hypothetical protein